MEKTDQERIDNAGMLEFGGRHDVTIQNTHKKRNKNLIIATLTSDFTISWGFLSYEFHYTFSIKSSQGFDCII